MIFNPPIGVGPPLVHAITMFAPNLNAAELERIFSVGFIPVDVWNASSNRIAFIPNFNVFTFQLHSQF